MTAQSMDDDSIFYDDDNSTDPERVWGRDIYYAALEGESELLKTLLAGEETKSFLATRPGGVIDHCANQGKWTPLMIACIRGHTECVQLLLPFSDPKAIDFSRSTPLMIAARAGHDSVLLETDLMSRSDFNAKDREGNTALGVAVLAQAHASVSLGVLGQEQTTLAVLARHAESAAVEAEPGGDCSAFELAGKIRNWGAVEILAPLASIEQIKRLAEEVGANVHKQIPRVFARFEFLSIREELQAHGARSAIEPSTPQDGSPGSPRAADARRL